MSTHDARLALLSQWCEKTLEKSGHSMKGVLKAIVGDASARRYFRCDTEQVSYIVMDSPPEKENCLPFIEIANRWFKAGVRVPQLFHINQAQGFIIMEDFGDHQLLSSLTSVESAAPFYLQALKHLQTLQKINTEHTFLPAYDEEKLTNEMALFMPWFFIDLLKLKSTSEDEAHTQYLISCLCQSALEQPTVVVHRDYHSRNLMLIEQNSMQSKLGIIDFQDAVIGPITYDVVSLLRDCYISWPQSDVYNWLHNFCEHSAHLKEKDPHKINQWFDWMGAQRHMKVLGIFSRLFLRDSKSSYLQDIPRVFAYFLWVCKRYDQFSEQAHWLEKRLLPELQKQSWWQPHVINN